MAALLGAEEYGFGSVAMIAEGCIMARVCHTNNCPVGVASQKEALRKRFTGIPEHVVNFFAYVAEEVRQLLSVLGVARLDDLIGRNDLLQPRTVQLVKTSSVDLSCLLDTVPHAGDRSWLRHDAAAHGNGPILEDSLLQDAEVLAAIEAMARSSASCGSSPPTAVWGRGSRAKSPPFTATRASTVCSISTLRAGPARALAPSCCAACSSPWWAMPTTTSARASMADVLWWCLQQAGPIPGAR